MLDKFKIEIMKDSNYDFITNYELETWTRCSSNYLDTWSVLTNQMLPELIKSTNIKSGDRVLDIGCGPGNSSNIISETGAEVTGIDFSQKMVDVAIVNFPKITFQQANAENIPTPDNSFDVVIANYLVHHLPDPEKVFSEIYRILKPNGRFAFAVWGPKEEQSSIGAFFQAFSNHHELAELPHGPLFGVTDFETYNSLVTKSNLKNFSLSKHKTVWNMVSLTPLIEGCWTWGNLFEFTKEKQDSIKVDFIKNCKSFANDNGYSFPHSAILGCATKK